MIFKQGLGKMYKIFIWAVVVLSIGCDETIKPEQGDNILISTSKEIPQNVVVKETIVQEDLFRRINELEGFENYTQNFASAFDENYRISFYMNKAVESQYLLTLEKFYIWEEGKVKSKVIDALIINNLDSNLSIAIGSCRFQEKPDRKIIAIYHDENNVEFYKKIIKAWSINMDSLQIHEIKTDEVYCINEGFGVD